MEKNEKQKDNGVGKDSEEEEIIHRCSRKAKGKDKWTKMIFQLFFVDDASRQQGRRRWWWTGGIKIGKEREKKKAEGCSCLN